MRRGRLLLVALAAAGTAAAPVLAIGTEAGEITKRAEPEPVGTGHSITYTIEVAGGPGAKSTSVRDHLPPGAVFGGVRGRAWSCSASAAEPDAAQRFRHVDVDCRSLLFAGGAGAIVIQVRAPAMPGPITNVAVAGKPPLAQEARAVSTVNPGPATAVQLNRGAAGVTLGLTRAQLVARLGEPLAEGPARLLRYAPGRSFEVRLDPRGRVRAISVAHPAFCVADAVCVGARRGVRVLRERFAAARPARVDGAPAYVVEGRFGGRKVSTAFVVERNSPAARVVRIVVADCAVTAAC